MGKIRECLLLQPRYEVGMEAAGQNSVGFHSLCFQLELVGLLLPFARGVEGSKIQLAALRSREKSLEVNTTHHLVVLWHLVTLKDHTRLFT